MSLLKHGKYRMSGDQLGALPSHWRLLPLKAVATHNDEVLEEDTAGDWELLYVDISSVDAARGIIAKEPVRFSEAPSRARRRVRDGDVIVSTVRTYLRAIATITDAEENLIVSTGFVVIRPGAGVDPRFLGFLLSSSYFVDQVIARSTGVSYPAINAGDLVRIGIPVPPMEDQVLVANMLEPEIARIAALISEQRRLINLLNEKRQALISYAVTKGLNPDAPIKPSGLEGLGDVPRHWEVVALKRVADVSTGIAKGKDNLSRSTIAVPYLRVANVQDGYLDLDDVASIEIPADELNRYALKRGDVLMNEGGDFDKLGRGCVWDAQIDPCITQNHVFAVRPRDISSHWLSAVIRSDYAQFYFMTRSKQSTNLASISSTNLMKLPVVIPPNEEQHNILDFIAEQEGRFESLVEESQRAVRLLGERRTALISAAVTGQIDVRSLAAVGVA